MAMLLDPLLAIRPHVIGKSAARLADCLHKSENCLLITGTINCEKLQVCALQTNLNNRILDGSIKPLATQLQVSITLFREIQAEE